MVRDTWGRGDFADRRVLDGNIVLKVVQIPAMFGDLFREIVEAIRETGSNPIKRTACMFQSWQFPWREIRQTGAF